MVSVAEMYYLSTFLDYTCQYWIIHAHLCFSSGGREYRRFYDHLVLIALGYSLEWLDLVFTVRL